AQAFSCLDRGADEDDAFDYVLPKLIDGHADREIGLAGAGRPDGEHEVVIAHGRDVTSLAIGARADAAIAGGYGQVLRPLTIVVLLDDGQHRADVLAAEVALFLEHDAQLLENALSLIDLGFQPFDVDDVATGDDADSERVPNEA